MTKQLTKEEYLRLINDTYQDSIYQDELNEDLRDPLNQEELNDIKRGQNIEVIDATKLSKNDIRKNIFKCNNFRIGKFIIKIMKYCGDPNKDDCKLNISLWEQIYKMIYRVDPHYIDGLTQCSALKYFNDSGVSKSHTATEITSDELINLIKYLQAINKIPAFL